MLMPYPRCIDYPGKPVKNISGVPAFETHPSQGEGNPPTLSVPVLDDAHMNPVENIAIAWIIADKWCTKYFEPFYEVLSFDVENILEILFV